jgi:outer membrane lipoprotein carrier protein
MRRAAAPAVCTALVAALLLGSGSWVLAVSRSSETRLASSEAQTSFRTAPELAQALQRKYETLKDFAADFTHTYRGGALRTALTEKGRLLVKRPGKMRWDYTSPERKQFVSDGVKIYSYLPADRQVLVSDVPREDQAATPALFLAGRGSLLKDFTATLDQAPADTPSGTRSLKLVPKSPQPDYDWLILLVDAGTLTLRGLVSADAQGGTSRFAFANLKENVGIADKEFEFKIPRGVDVVSDDASR